MSSPVTTRYADAFAAATAAQRAALLSRHGAASSEALAAPEAIRRRAAALSARDRASLEELLTFDPEFLEMAGDEKLPKRIFDAGLVFRVGEPGSAGSLVVPLEVRVALLDDTTASSAPLAALLGDWDHEELEDLAALHGVEVPDEGDPLGAAIAIADVLTDIERLDGVFDSLAGPAKRLTHWLCEVEEPVPQEKAAQMARRFAELAGDGAGTAEKVLQRLGISQEIQVEGDTLLVVPYDVREALRPIVETSLTERCRVCYESLRDSALPAFRDVFPHGAGGNPLIAARERLVRASIAGPDPRDRLDRVLLVFRALSDEQGVGDLASLHLDVATPERLAQEVFRSWLGSLDDDFTRVLVEPFGADCVALADWILDRGDDEDFSPDAEEWSLFLYELRANLLFTLGVLGPGLWHSVGALVDWLAAVYRRLLWHFGGFHGLADDAPEHAFPIPGVEITAEEEARLYEAIVILMVDLFEPIGAVRLDDTGTLFMTNPEAFRLFRDGEPGFDGLWTDVESYVGDDADLWLPVPTAWGARVAGVGHMRWVQEGAVDAVEVGDGAHVHDLVRLARWADPVLVGGSVRYVFGPDSVGRGQAQEDSDEFLLWLVVRTGAELPPAVRSLFPRGATAADGEEPLIDAARAVRGRVDELREWGEDVPLDVMEEIRSFGPAAAGVVVDALARAVEAGDWGAPLLRHLCVLAGELGVREAVPLLARVLGHATFEPAEGAAATALARIGDAAFEPVNALVSSPVVDVDKRLAAAGTLAAMAVLHPTTCDRAVVAMTQVAAAAEELPEDVPTLIGLFVAETGHPRAEQFVQALRDQGLWLEDVMPFDEALWVCGISPSVWGHPVFASPLAHLHGPRDEAERLRAARSEPEPEPPPRTRRTRK